MLAVNTYSHVGSRGLPWTSVNGSSTARCGKAASHFARGGLDPIGRPLDRRAGVVIEAVRVELAQRRGIVVATHSACVLLSETGDDLVWLRTVADDVTQLPDGVIWLERVEHRLQCGQVAVDVRQHGDPHRRSG